jgi:phage head morphogenesis protein, SPP1 gp7 family|nr:MAG TPA: minor capsid protein [Caudoviricetes sp.]DAS41852.1 MAG TPA: minor capsid protein [Caudoviricetes sp.]
MRTTEYWQSRFEEVEKRCHNKGAVAYKEIEEQYRQAQRELESQISVWYQRFAKNNDITMQEARRLLTSGELAELKWDVNEYIKYGQQNAIDGKWMKQLENASARAHISRLEALKLQLQQQVEVAFGNQLDSVDSAMRAVYSMGYMHTAFEIQKGFGVGHNFAMLNQTLIDRILNRPWSPDGKNFSDRIWGNKQKLINELNTTLTQGIILGKDPQKIINGMSKRLNVSKTNAGRLVMTESAAFASRAQEDCFKELGVEEYEIVATLDSHTSEICQDMDGKVFKMSERQIGINAPPFHVYCRTTTVPYFNDEWSKNTERAARDENGDTYYVPENMTYKEWEKKFVKEHDKNNSDVVKPDFKIKKAKDSNVSKNEERDTSKMVIGAIDKLPEKVKKSLNNVVVEYGHNGSSCDIANKIIRIGIGAEEEDVFHEMGHLVENYMMDPKKVKEYKESLVAGLGINDIIKVTYENSIGIDEDIYVLRGKSFESEYQSRLYVSTPEEAINLDGSIKTEVMVETVSEVFRKYMIGETLSEEAIKLIGGVV